MILGIDEVGRGPWAGPLVVGAVILGDKFPADIKLTDSKKLTAKKRESLEPLILENSLAHGLGWVSAAELDQYGLSASLKLATCRAVKEVLAQIAAKNRHTTAADDTKIEIDQIIIDGTINFLAGTPLEDRVSTLPKADALVKEVSAASIIAKVARDRYMAKIALQYPVYGFEKHVGYGTALHQKVLEKHGICPEHRQSFRPIREVLKKVSQNPAKIPQNHPEASKNPSKIIQNPAKSPETPPIASKSATKFRPPSSSEKGQTAELAVASYLKTQNHEIIADNFKTKSYEIDLISVESAENVENPSKCVQKSSATAENPEIFFTEVKYSQNLHTEGTPLVRITPKKQQQMRFAAERFQKSHPEYRDFSPILAAASVSGPDFQVDDWFVLT